MRQQKFGQIFSKSGDAKIWSKLVEKWSEMEKKGRNGFVAVIRTIFVKVEQKVTYETDTGSL